MSNKTQQKKFDAVTFKRDLQKQAEEKLSKLSDKEQIEFLRLKYGNVVGQERTQLAENVI